MQNRYRRAKELNYGWYSNRTQGFGKARGPLPPVTPDQPTGEAERAPLALRRTWARLIRKIYEVDPLLCSRCGATMQVIAAIEDEEVIYRILAHLHLLAPGDGPRAPPKSAGLRGLIYEPVFDLPVRRTQTGDLPWMDPPSFSLPERTAMERVSPVLALIPDLTCWTPPEKRALARIIWAKGACRESDYIRLLREHPRLGRALCDLARSARSPVSLAR